MADIDEIKAQCPFCKIVAGEYPSNVIYEDEHVKAVMDINPAVKGSVLVMTKEHYPFLQALPPPVFDHVSKTIRELSTKISEAMLTPGCELVISSGSAAGQPLFHFSYYLVPREGGDGLNQFEVPVKELDKTAVDQLKSVLANNLKLSYGRHLGGKQEVPELTKDKVMEIINANPQIKEMILKDPEEFKKAIPMNPQLQTLFSKVSVDEIIEELKAGNKAEKKVSEEAKASDEGVSKGDEKVESKVESEADLDEDESDADVEETKVDKDDNEGDMDVDDISELFS